MVIRDGFFAFGRRSDSVLIVLARDLGAVPAPLPEPEFAELRGVQLAPRAIDRLWQEFGPDELTPVAAITLAALERELSNA